MIARQDRPAEAAAPAYPPCTDSEAAALFPHLPDHPTPDPVAIFRAWIAGGRSRPFWEWRP
jgi:hypothetical protein